MHPLLFRHSNFIATYKHNRRITLTKHNKKNPLPNNSAWFTRIAQEIKPLRHQAHGALCYRSSFFQHTLVQNPIFPVFSLPYTKGSSQAISEEEMHNKLKINYFQVLPLMHELERHDIGC